MDLKVGEVVRAKWAVGPATQGSGWVPAERLTPEAADEWTVTDVNPSYATVQHADGGAKALIHDGEYLADGRLPNGEPCAYASDYGRDAWAEHDHGACLDADTDSAIRFAEFTEPLDAGGRMATEIGFVQGVGTEYRLWALSQPTSEPGEWTHEFVAVIYPPTPRMGKPKRSQSFPSNAALLAAVGADIDADLAVEASS